MLDCESVKVLANPYKIAEYPTTGLLDDRIKQFGDHIWDEHFYDKIYPWDYVGRKLITRAPNGSFWFTRTASNEIGSIPGKLGDLRLRSVDNPRGYPNEATFRVPTSFAGLQDIVAAPNGDIWFTERWANKIGRIRFDSHKIDEFAIPSEGSHPVGIAVGPDGNIWFTETKWRTPKIGRLNLSNGEPLDEAHRWNEFALHAPDDDEHEDRGTPTEIIVGPDGNLWFGAGDALVRMTTQGEMTWFHSTPPDAIRVIGATPGFLPTDLAFSSDGSIWFTSVSYNVDSGSSISGPIGRMRPDGSFSFELYPNYYEYIDEHDPRPNHAESITSGPDGSLWVTGYKLEDHAGILRIVPPQSFDDKLGLSWYPLPSVIDKHCWQDLWDDYRYPNLPLGIVGSRGKTDDEDTPDEPGEEWQVVFLEPRANQIGIARLADLGAPVNAPVIITLKLQPVKNACGLLNIQGGTVKVWAEVSGVPAHKRVKYQWQVDGAQALPPTNGWMLTAKITDPKAVITVSVTVTLGTLTVTESTQLRIASEEIARMMELKCQIIGFTHRAPRQDPLWDPPRDLVTHPYTWKEINQIRATLIHLGELSSEMLQLIDKAPLYRDIKLRGAEASLPLVIQEEG